MKIFAVVVAALALLLAKSDFHARFKDSGGIGNNRAAAKTTPEITHRTRLINGLLDRAKKAPPKKSQRLLAVATNIAVKNTKIHPQDPRSWAVLWKCYMLANKPYKAYAAISRAVYLDRTLAVHRRIHAQTAWLVNDRPGLEASKKILARVP